MGLNHIFLALSKTTSKMNLLQFIQHSTGFPEKSIANTVQLLQDGATVPFIARYRKEMTGVLDEVQISTIRDLAKKHEEIEARQKAICKAIEEQGKLVDELASKIKDCYDINLLEDLYLPYKQKRLTRGEKAKKLGLEPLAKMIISQKGGDPYYLAERFVKGEVLDESMALAGAKDIMAEYMNENAVFRARLRTLFQRKSVLSSKIMKGKMELGEKYKDYFEFSEPLYKIPSHRFLALYRGEREGILSIKALPEKEQALELMERFFVKTTDACGQMVKEVCSDAYQRLLAPSLENEIIQEAKDKADKAAIQVFSTNLKQLLLAPPLGAKRILAIDPGFRTGCKVVCLDENGDLLMNTTVFPHAPQNERDKSSAKIYELVQAYKIEAIAIGDGTAGRETENLIKHIRFDRDLEVFSVREDGASIYSASSIARKEFPTFDVTVRGAVSIGRRLMDPLAELVKIDPKSVGVGQYQHEVNQNLLKNALDDVVISAVNAVGVDLNTASPYLLSYVSGLSLAVAENIVQYRQENGAFRSRFDLKKVKRLGDKSFEQAAGFLRIQNATHPLDNSAVHPEIYPEVDQIAKQLKVKLTDLIGNEKLVNQIQKKDFTGIDSYTFDDLISELKKPGRDPRKKAKVLEFSNSIRTISDLIVGMKLPGIVTNVTAFGAFVNLGIKENGLIHKSNLAEVFVEDPAQFIKLHEHVQVEVLEVDVERKRVGLKRIQE
jgi:uncharacterized protein